MATVNNWIDHLTAASKADGVAGVIIWIGWTVISSRQESDKLEKLARKRPSSNAWKSNITDG